MNVSCGSGLDCGRSGFAEADPGEGPDAGQVAGASVGWAEAAARKRGYWVDRYAVEGAAATLDASDALREHMKEVRPAWPTAAERAADLDQHCHMRWCFERVADAFRRR